jgi:glycerophosphoryl diester phosphodiesterase
LLTPIGLVFVVVVVALTVSLLLAEFAGLSFISEHAIDRRPVTLAATIAYVVRTLPDLVLLAARMFLRLVALALPFLAAAGLVWFTLLRGHDINYYLAEHPPEWMRAKRIAMVLAAGYGALAGWQIARWLHVVPVLVLEGASPMQAFAEGRRLMRGQMKRVVPPLVLWWLLVTAAAVAIAWVGRQISDAGLDWAGLDVHRVLPLVAVYMAVTTAGSLLYGGLHLTGHQFLLTRMCVEQTAPDRRHSPHRPAASGSQERSLARPVVITALALAGLSIGAAAFLLARLELAADVAITAHRGAKVAAPENTLASFRAALDAGTDYVELDVQRTRDGEIVVIHDGDLMRMGDDPRKVAELATNELAGIDVGRKYDVKFTGERVPTLGDVIELVRGRARINIELKYNVPDPGLALAVVELLRQKQFLDQVVITSLDYAALRQVEGIEPRLKTGHIVTAAVGDVVRTEADFLSLNSARASASLVRRAHTAGKEVAVWTVNDPEVMLRMLERGVDNVITDDPALLVRVLRERMTLSKAERLGLRLRILFSKPPRGVTDPETVEPL